MFDDTLPPITAAPTPRQAQLLRRIVLGGFMMVRAAQRDYSHQTITGLIRRGLIEETPGLHSTPAGPVMRLVGTSAGRELVATLDAEGQGA